MPLSGGPILILASCPMSWQGEHIRLNTCSPAAGSCPNVGPVEAATAIPAITHVLSICSPPLNGIAFRRRECNGQHHLRLKFGVAAAAAAIAKAQTPPPDKGEIDRIADGPALHGCCTPSSRMPLNGPAERCG